MVEGVRLAVMPSEVSYLQLRQHLGDVGLAGQSDHDVELLQLDVDWVVVLHEEDFHLVLEDVRPLLNDEIDVPESHVLRLEEEEEEEKKEEE